MKLKVVVPPHPLIGHWLTTLRNASTPPQIYAKGLEQLGKWLTYEATRNWIPHKNEKVQTTHQSITSGVIIDSGIRILAITSLPAGLELWNGGKEILPNVSLCLDCIPNEIDQTNGVVIYEDMISDGISLTEKLKKLEQLNVNAERIRIITAISSAPGLSYVGENFPDMTIYTSCIDEKLQNNSEIFPGIGNPTDRIDTIIR